MRTSTAGPLAGIRVLDFTFMMAGPYCTRLLADLGAEVIKIEPPKGDHVRMRPPLRDGHSTYFGQLNCGKKSIALDLKTPEGRDAALELAAVSDVVVESFRPGVMRRFGLDYATVSAKHKELVYCSISGFGQDGSASQRAAYAPVIHAASGYDLAHRGYQSDASRPANTGIFIADVLGGALAFGGIQAALVARHRTGEGDYVDLSMMDAMFGLLVYECQGAQFPDQKRKPPVYQPVKAKDGYLVLAPISQQNFEGLAHASGHPDWIRDSRFVGPVEREMNWKTLTSLIEDWASQRTAEECEQILFSKGVPCSRYLTVREAMHQPQVVERGTFSTARDRAGDFQVTNPPFKFARAAAGAGSIVPELGEHGPSILRDLLGYDEKRIAKALTREGLKTSTDHAAAR